MSASFTNQVLAQLELASPQREVRAQGYVLPKALDEEVARLHLAHLGVRLTTLTDDQASYLGIPVAAPTSRITTATEFRTPRKRGHSPFPRSVELELRDERKMVARNARDTDAAAPCAGRTAAVPVIDLVESAGR